MINNEISMKHILFAGLLLSLAFSASGFERGKIDSEYSTKNAKIKFITYQNGAAEYVIDIPMEILYPQGESGNHMGQVFKSAEMDAQLFTYGKGNPDNQTIDDLFFDSLNPENKNELVFTYKIIADWVS